MKLLVALDGSDISEKVISRCMELASSPASDEVILINVQSREDRMDDEDPDSDRITTINERKKKKGLDLLSIYEKLLRSANFLLTWDKQNIHLEVKIGDTRTILCDYVELNKIQFLILGTRGHTGIKSTILGSVSQYCAQYAACNVIVVKPRRLSVSSVPRLEKAPSTKLQLSEERVGLTKVATGFKPKYPVVIVPGLISSALEAWQSPNQKWFQERVWLSFNKLTMDKKSWLQHMKLQNDCVSDPPGIQLRAVPGLHGIDALQGESFGKSATYLFFHIIKNLADIGYNDHNLVAAPYDWRLSPRDLDSRDGYFLKLKALIEVTHLTNNEKVLLVVHSMGNKLVLYFFQWIMEQDPKWIDNHIYAYFAIAPAFLGSAKALRTVVSGHKMGLDLMVDLDEAVDLCRSMGSGPLLFPIFQQLHKTPTFCYLRDENSKSYHPRSIQRILIDAGGENCWNTFQEKYVKEPYYLNGNFTDNPNIQSATNIKEFMETAPPILRPPPVKKFFCAYGVNIDTEVQFFFKHNEKRREGNNNNNNGLPYRLLLDTEADNLVKGSLRIDDLTLQGGIAYETSFTFQPTAEKRISGDGTVPYASLNYCSQWKYFENHPTSMEITEIPGAKHKEVLQHPKLIGLLIDYACGVSIHKSSSTLVL